jgi:carbon storage regulator
MLVLSRKLHEIVRIGDDIEVMVVDIDHNKVRLGITAPRNVPVHRLELLQRNTPHPSSEIDSRECDDA